MQKILEITTAKTVYTEKVFNKNWFKTTENIRNFQGENSKY